VSIFSFSVYLYIK